MIDDTPENTSSQLLTPEEKSEQLIQDSSISAVAGVIRENASLRLSIKFHRRKILFAWGVTLTMAIAMLVCLCAILWWFPKYRYIATTDSDAICGISPEDAPRVSLADLTEFGKDAVIQSYTYDYVNYRTQINYVSDKFFNQTGKKAFLASLQSSGNLDRVIQGRLILRATATRVPQLEEEGRMGSRRYWIIQIPVAIEFYSGGAQQPISRQDFLASTTIVQEPANASNRKGIAVESMILSPYVPPRL